MTSVIHKAESRGYANHGWLKSYHTFSFARYYDPGRVHFGAFRVLNDDYVAPGTGFGTHPHDNMEIITIPLAGAVRHRDSTGHEEVIYTNDVQIMSAGSGLTHSEMNASRHEEVNLLQLWIFPKLKDIPPRYDQKTFDPQQRQNRFLTVVSPEEKDNALWINQDAYLSLASFDPGLSLAYQLRKPGNGVYFFVIDGTAQVGDIALSKRDAVGLSDLETVTVTAGATRLELLAVEVPMQ